MRIGGFFTGASFKCALVIPREHKPHLTTLRSATAVI